MYKLRYKKYLYLCTVHFKIKSGQRTGISSTSMNPTVRNKHPLMENLEQQSSRNARSRLLNIYDNLRFT